MNNAPRKKEGGLVYYLHDGSAAFRFQLAGHLSQDSTGELEQARQTASSIIGRRCLVVDLTDLTGADAAGHELLREWHALGAQLTVLSSGGQARIGWMTGLPVTIVGTKPEASRWQPSRAAALGLAALLALLLAATALAGFRQVHADADMPATVRIPAQSPIGPHQGAVKCGMFFQITRGEGTYV